MPLSGKGAKLIVMSSVLVIGCSPSANSVATSASTDTDADADTEVNSIATACPQLETLYFSCETSSGGHVSICGRNKDSLLNLTYRHNEGGRITLEHHWNSAAGPGGRFTQNAYHRYRAEYNEVGFALVDKEYKIFSHYAAEEGLEMFSRGVRIQDVESGEEIRALQCMETQVDEIKKLIPILECDLDSALGCAD